MIIERYCSFEVSKLLKEKGFDEKTLAYYDDGILCNGDWFEWNRSPLGHISAPTHQMACDYLREEHNILIWFYPVIPIPIPKDKTVFYWEWKTKKKLHSYPHVHNHIKYETYEEAVEEALKYCLIELI